LAVLTAIPFLLVRLLYAVLSILRCLYFTVQELHAELINRMFDGTADGGMDFFRAGYRPPEMRWLERIINDELDGSDLQKPMNDRTGYVGVADMQQ
jgi:hypothetical protein